MAGIISPSMPLWVVENKAHGNRAYSNFNEGLGKVLRFGANGPEVIDRLRWIASDLAPTLRAALARTGGIELKPLMAQALNMGDEVHNRNAAATALLFKRLAPALFDADVPRDAAARGARVHRRQRPLLPQPVDGRVQGDARRGGGRARQLDGRRDGAQRRQLRRSPRRAPASAGSRRRPIPSTGCTFPATRSPTPRADLGDSAITETAGVGGFAMAAAPAIVKFVGGTPADAIAPQPAHARDHARRQSVVHAARARLRRRRPRASTRARSSTRGVLPVINSGIAHRAGGRRADRRRRHHRADGVLRRGGEGAGARACEARTSRERRAVSQRSLLAVVAVGGNALIRDAQHTALARPVRRRLRNRGARRRHDRRGLERRAHARQRPAGRLHPAPLGDRRRPGADGADPLRGRRHAGRDRLHVPERDR